MQKVSIKPQALTIKQSVRLFDALDYTGRQEFYKSLSDDEKDALYEQVTDNLIASVHLTTKNRIDAKMNKDRNDKRGYIVPYECHITQKTSVYGGRSRGILRWGMSQNRCLTISHTCASILTHYRRHKSMNQKRKFRRDFSYGGYAIFADGRRMHACVQVEGSKIFKVSIPKKENDDGSYLHSDSLEYDLRKKRDIYRLRRKGIIGFSYETPTETSLFYQEGAKVSEK